MSTLRMQYVVSLKIENYDGCRISQDTMEKIISYQLSTVAANGGLGLAIATPQARITVESVTHECDITE